MKIQEYMLESDKETINERPMNLVQKGVTSLGAKVLPGSLGAKAQGKLDTGNQANQLYKDFNTFLGKTGQTATDTALKGFLQQAGIKVNIDDIINQSVPQTPVKEAGMPSKVAAHKNKLSQMSPEELYARFKNVAARNNDESPANIENLARSMAWRHGYGKMSDFYWKQFKHLLNGSLSEDIALGRNDLNKIFMKIAQNVAKSGATVSAAPGGQSAAASKTSAEPGADTAEPSSTAAPLAAKASSTSAGKATAPAADKTSPTSQGGGTTAPAAGTTTGAAPAATKSPNIVKRAASAIGGAAKAVKNVLWDREPKQTTNKIEPTVGQPKTSQSATGQGSSIEGYMQNWAKTINATKDPNQKIALAKEVIGFLGDRKGQPEADRAITQAASVLKRSGINSSLNSKFLRALQTGSAKMERKMYILSRLLLELTGLTWKDLGMRIVLSESNLDYVLFKKI